MTRRERTGGTPSATKESRGTLPARRMGRGWLRRLSACLLFPVLGLLPSRPAAGADEVPARKEDLPGWRQPRYSLFFPDTQYHAPVSDDGVPEDQRLKCCVQHSVDGGYDLAFVEFDSQGDYWDRRQLSVARAQFRQRMRGKPLLVEYVHGWHFNAQEDTGRDVEHFRTLLRLLARSEYIRDQGYQVFGVYLAWRGEQYRPDHNPLSQLLLPAHLLSFYSSKHRAEQIGSMPMLSETLFWMVHEARMRSPSESRTVLMGHSFGALVLENALAQAIASSAAMILPGHKEAPRPADLVLLINAASESLRAKGLAEMFGRMGRHAMPGYRDANRPILVNVTSRADDATGFAFPAGTSLGDAFTQFRSYRGMGRELRDEKGRVILDEAGRDRREMNFNPPLSQRVFLTHTAGHNEYLINHEVQPDEARIDASLAREPKEAWQPPELFQRAFDRNLQAVPKRGGQDGLPSWSFWSVGKKDLVESKIQRLPDVLATPYWIVSVPKSVIAGHDDAFSPQAMCLYAAIFRLANNGSGTSSGER